MRNPWFDPVLGSTWEPLWGGVSHASSARKVEL